MPKTGNPKSSKSKKSISILLILALLAGLLIGCSNSKAASAQINEKLELAVKYLSENKYEEAILTYQDVIKIDSKNITAYKGLSLAYQLDNKMDLAEKALADGLQAVPQTPQLKLAQAGLMLDQGKADQAEAIYKELTSVNTPPLSAYRVYTYYLNKQGKQAEAIALLERAAAKNTKDNNLNSMLAELYYQSGDQEKALAAINNSLNGQSVQAGSYKLLAEMYQDKWTELIALGDQYIQQNKAQTGQLLKLSGLFGLGKYDEVIKQYGELAGDLKNNARASLIAAHAYLKLDKKDQIAELLKPLKVAELHDAGILAELANIYLETGDKENARKLALQGIGSDESIIDNYIVMYKSYEGEDKSVAQVWAIKYLIMSGLSSKDSLRELSKAGIDLGLAKEESNNESEKIVKTIVRDRTYYEEALKKDEKLKQDPTHTTFTSLAYLDTKSNIAYMGYCDYESNWKPIIVRYHSPVLYSKDNIPKEIIDQIKEYNSNYLDKILANYQKFVWLDNVSENVNVYPYDNNLTPIQIEGDLPLEEHLKRAGYPIETITFVDL